MMSNGQIGPFVVKAPMVLGHEAAGTIVEVGSEVTNFKVGDRVCMEPGIPDPNSWETQQGIYNLDPAVRFWATPRVSGPYVAHPTAYSFRLHVSSADGWRSLIGGGMNWWKSILTVFQAT
jgi:D-xylulose reductase